jgi:pimeloyl-ACP methyl ester carboxylesterase
MPFKPIPGTDEQYGLISFDANGNERTDEAPGLFSQTLLDWAKREQPTNIFFFSHGWKGDIPAAVDQYNRWIGAMAALKADRERMGPAFKPMWIGLHWPSQPYGEESLASVSFGTEGDEIQKLVDEAVAHFGGGEDVRRPLEIIFASSVTDAGATEVPPEVNRAYQDLAKAIGFKAGAGAGAAPDEDGVPLDPQGALEAANLTGASFGLGDKLMSGILGGVRQLSFWTMKKRARTVGENGMHRFIAALMKTTKAHIHLMGHSFGCIVTSSILGGPNGRTPLPRPVSSVVLVQGAFSLWSYADGGRVPDSAKPGYFNNVIPSKAVSGPFITTQSRFDTAVGSFYPAAVFLDRDVSFAPVVLPKSGAVGAFGIQGTTTVPGKLLHQTADYRFEGGRIYNLDSDQFIRKMAGASGAHSDIDGPEVAHALWQAALASQDKEMATHG